MTAAGSQKNRGRGCPSNKESWENDVRTNLLFCIGIVAGCQRFICFDDAGGGQAGKKLTPQPQYPVVYTVRPSAGAAAGGDRLFRGQLCTGKMAAAGQGVAGGNGSVFCPSSAGILSFEQAAQPRGAPSFFKPCRAAGDSAGVL